MYVHVPGRGGNDSLPRPECLVGFPFWEPNDDLKLLCLGLGVVVDALACFTPQPSSLHILHQKWCRPVFLAEDPLKVLKNMQTRIESDQIHQLERAHGMVQA